LRERTGDIQVLAEHFLEKFCKKYQKPLLHISSSLVKKLEAYRWPGNIRELEHAIERAVILAENNQLSSDDFLLKTSSNPQVHSQSTNLEDLEKTTIQSVIEKYKGNMSKVAKELGIGRTTLYRKLEKYGI
jgi:DNA-binding NtrC family response regulator